jgi:ABC-2 type transport system permease protein
MPGGTGRWLTAAWVLVLGMAATMPLGMMLGAVLPNVQKLSGWGMLPALLVTAISGDLLPAPALWGWLQPVAPGLPGLLARARHALGVPP